MAEALLNIFEEHSTQSGLIGVDLNSVVIKSSFKIEIAEQNIQSD